MVRAKQIDMEELYEILDPRYDSSNKTVASVIENLVVGTNWNVSDTYYTQTIENIDETITTESKMIIQPKFSIEKTYEENLANENLFANIIKATPGEKSITLFSKVALDAEFTVQVLFFN